MNMYAMLLLIQETLPPPPEPSSTPDINTAQVIGIVILSLGLIVVAALAVRPLVGRVKRAAAPETEPTPPEETLPPAFDQGSHRPILQFPSPAAKGPEKLEAWNEPNPVVEERFGRVIGDSINRRKLGDRRPARRAHDLAIAALHRLDTDPQPRNGARGTAVAERPIVPLDERRLAALERVPQGQILQWQGAVAADPDVSMATVAGAAAAPARPVRSVHGAEESFERWPLNDRAQLDQPPAANADPTPDAATSDANTEEFVVVRRDQIEAAEMPPPVASPPYGVDVEGVDTRTLAEISQVLRDLIYCANAGELFHGFALYSDPYLFRFMDGTGLTEDEFRDVYGSIGSRPQAAWERLDRLSDVVRRPDSRVEATVSYVDVAGKPISGRERFRFAFDSERRVWMIDDIASIEGPAQ